MKAHRARSCAAMLVVCCVCACARPSKPSGGNAPEMRMWGVQMVSFRGPRKVASGTAAALAFERDSADVSGNEAAITFLKAPAGTDLGTPGSGPAPSQASEPDTTILASQLRGNFNARGIDGEGGVTVSNPQGMVAHTPRAHLDLATNLATGPGPTDIIGRGYDVRGRGFRVDLSTGAYLLSGPDEITLGGSR